MYGLVEERATEINKCFDMLQAVKYTHDDVVTEEGIEKFTAFVNTLVYEEEKKNAWKLFRDMEEHTNALVVFYFDTNESYSISPYLMAYDWADCNLSTMSTTSCSYYGWMGVGHTSHIIHELKDAVERHNLLATATPPQL